MNTLEYQIDGKKQTVQIPETIAECTGEQLVTIADACLGELSEDDTLVSLCNLPKEIVIALSSYQKFKLIESIEPVFRFNLKKQMFKEWKFPFLKVDNDIFYGLTSNFGNVTWGEFIYIDQCMINKLYQAAICAMFRPERKGYDYETDRRIPFTVQGTSHRYERFNSISKAQTSAILINYKAMRAASIESFYSALFPYFDVDDFDDEDMDEPDTDKTDNQEFSWINVHRNILGENIHIEPQILNLPVHTVLARLNQAAIDQRKKVKTQ